MTLPKGAIYQLLRQRAIDAIPPGTQLNFRHAPTLADWQRTGAYVVASATAKKIALVAPTVEVGSALLSDAQFHLDHAAEHQTAMWHDLRSGQWNSPAWLTVTFYYWGYFAGMAFSRMLGDTVWFVDDAVATQLSTLAPGAAKSGAGTYQFLCRQTVSATERTILLQKRTGRIHEQLWSTVFSLIGETYALVPKGSAEPFEERIYLALIDSARRFGQDWPSQLRNLVNYRPGLAYDAVRGGTLLDSFGFVRWDTTHDLHDLVGRLETNIISAGKATSVKANLRLATHILVDLTFLLHLLAKTLHDDLVERHGLDRRWSLKRASFAGRSGVVLGAGEWPCL